MSNTTRKVAVVTSQVQSALAQYASTREMIGLKDTTGHEFDKGLRGKGFAQYDSNGNVVRTFETKDEAFAHYNGWTVTALEVLKAVGHQELAESKGETAKKATEKAAA